MNREGGVAQRERTRQLWAAPVRAFPGTHGSYLRLFWSRSSANTEVLGEQETSERSLHTKSLSSFYWFCSITTICAPRQPKTKQHSSSSGAPKRNVLKNLQWFQEFAPLVPSALSQL